MSIAGIMAAARASDDHGGGGDHGGRSAILDSNRRRMVGILCGGIFFLLFKNFDSMQRNSKTRFYHSAETSAIESSSKSGLEKVFKS